MTLPPMPPWLPLTAALVSVLALLFTVLVGLGQRRALRRLLAAVSEPELRRAVLRASGALEPLTERVTTLEQAVEALRHASARALTAPGVVRFQAFPGDGPAASFCVALLDGHRDGVILTSLHARDQVRLYAKEVAGGQPAHALSEEEAQAMAQTLGPAPTPAGVHPPTRRNAR